MKPDVAMTGELTLRGRVLAIGGLKEKVMAAHREGLKTVLFPFSNTKDLEEIPKDIQAQLSLIPVADAHEALSLALAPAPGKVGEKIRSRGGAWPVPMPPTGQAPDIKPGVGPGAPPPA